MGGWEGGVAPIPGGGGAKGDTAPCPHPAAPPTPSSRARAEILTKVMDKKTLKSEGKREG